MPDKQLLARWSIGRKRGQTAVIAIHGRGGSASRHHRVGKALSICPRSPGWRQRPQVTPGIHIAFLTAVDQNQPFLDSAISVVGGLLQHLEDSGIPAERVVLLGFSQGACLASEFVARHPRRYGGLIVFSGGLIGEKIDPSAIAVSCCGTPVVGGCSDVDPHIPLERLRSRAGAGSGGRRGRFSGLSQGWGTPSIWRSWPPHGL